MEEWKKNFIISSVCGLVFGLSWWLMIDIAALYPEASTFRRGLLYLPICLSTISLFVNSAVPNSSLVDHYSVSKIVFFHRLIFFLSTVLGFSGFLAAVIICCTSPGTSLPIYVIVGVPLLNGLILIVNLTFKFAVTNEDEDEI